MANKVYFGLKNVMFGSITHSGSTYTYGAPVAWPGAVNFAATPNGEENEFEADNMVYFSTPGTSGYDISYECAEIPEGFLESYCGYAKDANNVIVDNSGELAPFYLVGQIDGDANNTLFAFYNCMLSTKPALEAETSRAKAPKTRTLSITAYPSEDSTLKGACMARTKSDTPSTVSSGWFTTLYKPSIS